MDLLKTPIESVLLVMETFEILSQIEFVIKDKFIKVEKQVSKTHTLIETTGDENIVKSAIKFLIFFYVTSFKLNMSENFKFFLKNESHLEDKLWKVLESSKWSEEVKFGVCLLLFSISIKEKIWTKLKNLNLIKPSVQFMLSYLTKFFRVKNQENFDSEWIQMLIHILSFISTKENYQKIFHVGYFKEYFNVVLVLFGVNLPEWRHKVLTAMNAYTYYYDCKKIVLETKDNKCIRILYERISQTFINLMNLNKIYSECKRNIDELSKRSANSSANFKSKFQEDARLYEDTAKDVLNVYLVSVQEFTLLLSIFVNLMMTNDFRKSRSSLVLDEAFFPTMLKKKGKKESNEKKNELGSNNNVQHNKFSEKIDFRYFSLEVFDSFFKGEMNSNNLKKNKTHDKMIKEEIRPFNNYALVTATQSEIEVIRCQSQITLAMLIFNPEASIEGAKKSYYNEKDEDVVKLQDLIDRLKQNKFEEDTLHKLIYATNRFLEKQTKFKELMENIRKLIDLIKEILYKSKSLVVVNRECLRLLITITTYAENTFLWLKFDSKKVHVDYANFSDAVLLYKDRDTIWEEEESNTRNRLLFPPHMKVKSYADKMGVIFYDSHVLVLPKSIHLGEEFTVWFRFFNPVINNGKWHVLLQDPSGIGALVCIDPSRRRLGLFSAEGFFEDSGIDLTRNDLNLKWVQVCLSVNSKADHKGDSEQITLEWYLNGKTVNQTDKKIALPKFVQYVGNSRDYNEPFGVFCDLRVYKTCLNAERIGILYSSDESGRKNKNDSDLIYSVYQRTIDAVIQNFLESKDNSEESFYFAIKFFNNLMAMRGNRAKFINYRLIMKVNQFLKSSKVEIKKDVCKFLQTIS